jgi:hypothetical protein
MNCEVKKVLELTEVKANLMRSKMFLEYVLRKSAVAIEVIIFLQWERQMHDIARAD